MISGRVWKFGDNISTDLMLPGPALALVEKEQIRWVFQANRPGWVDEVRPGDIVIGGKSYGIGSGSMRNLGIGCLIADSINRLFFRNCVGYGLIALSCPGVSAAFEEGHIAEVSVAARTVRNQTTGQTLSINPIPERLAKLMLSGGIYPLLEREGFIAPLVA